MPDYALVEKALDSFAPEDGPLPEDEPVEVIADTTAMGDPIEIEYTLTFYSESVGDKNRIPQEAAQKVLCTSLVIIAVEGVLNHFVKKRRR